MLPEQIEGPRNNTCRKRFGAMAAKASEFLVHVGVLRLLDDGPGPRDATQQSSTARCSCRQKLSTPTTQEGLDHDESAAQVRAVRTLDNMPLIVLTGGGNVQPPVDGTEPANVMAAYMQRRIYGTQAHLATLSTRGRQVILPVGHGIPTEDPLAVIEAVRAVTLDVRGLPR